ncbi:hypothetical protein NQZ79_g5393 [Umbelopsis isabellina]|nr:hypothetical protein NQZ79_g5393 [Umbelopsis isabellina]
MFASTVEPLLVQLLALVEEDGRLENQCPERGNSRSIHDALSTAFWIPELQAVPHRRDCLYQRYKSAASLDKPLRMHRHALITKKPCREKNCTSCCSYCLPLPVQRTRNRLPAPFAKPWNVISAEPPRRVKPYVAAVLSLLQPSPTQMSSCRSNHYGTASVNNLLCWRWSYISPPWDMPKFIQSIRTITAPSEQLTAQFTDVHLVQANVFCLATTLHAQSPP